MYFTIIIVNYCLILYVFFCELSFNFIVVNSNLCDFVYYSIVSAMRFDVICYKIHLRKRPLAKAYIYYKDVINFYFKSDIGKA